MAPDPRPASVSPLAQIRRLVGTMSLREVTVVYADEWIAALLRPIPSFLGAGLRWAYCRLTFARLDGFCFIRPGARITYSCGMSVGRNLHLNGGTFIGGAHDLPGFAGRQRLRQFRHVGRDEVGRCNFGNHGDRALLIVE